MKTKTNLILTRIILLIVLVLLSFNVSAVGNYVNDEANVLSSGIISKTNDNFAKLEKNTKAQVKIYVLKSLNGKNIDDMAIEIANKETSTDKYAIFVVAVKEHKNKFIVGKGLNDVFNRAELDRIANLPDSYFKSNDFNTGILKVGQAIDQDITTKAVKTGEAVVKTDRYSKTVEPKKSHASSIILVIILIIAVVGFIYYIKRKSDKRVREFAGRHNLNDSSSNKFKSADMEENTYKSNNSSTYTYNEEPRHTNYNDPNSRVVHNTTVINNGNNMNGFVEGMLVNEMLNNHHEHHSHYEENRIMDDRQLDTTPSYTSNDDENKLSSGDWGLSSGSSDWGSSSDSGSWDSGSSDSGSSDW
ncbi:TPM domain-containing protein [Clostridium sp. OS1-26]|uniref:TPM domain-containing protein n=1 Tax=Clostridium sp. OS1-26 TaxID=3070681 RepID=UPI0027E0CEF8|nr:TPM domain-containing protein [Clostridium sp. OS1-26]WML33237.1 TPM domain-containing protein [Clostridium sp. OS1-26]